MKIAFINGSPKKKRSSSERIIAALIGRLKGAHEYSIFNVTYQDSREILSSIQNADALVFVFPLYVDSLPSRLVKFLDDAQSEIASLLPGAKVYAAVNNGFYEARQNATAISIMKNFCSHTGLMWGQGVGIGAGAIIPSVEIGRGPLKNLAQTLDVFSDNIFGLKTAEDHFVEPNYPRLFYNFGGNTGWKRAAKKRGLTVKELYK
jgi:multimeric flavodoxin WrbA